MSPFNDFFEAVDDQPGHSSVQLSTADESDLSELEKDLNSPLPVWYRDFLRHHNPIDAEIQSCRIHGIDGLLEEHTESYPGVELLEQGFLIVAMLGSDVFCINVGNHDDLCVYIFDPATERCIKKFLTFEDFLWGLLDERITESSLVEAFDID